jgi:hypothetical protein
MSTEATGQSANSAVRLENLPVEIQQEIFHLLCPHCTGEALRPWTSDGQKALRILSSLTKNFRDIAQPLLYHRISTGTSYMGLVRTLNERPDLAAKVKQYQQPSYMRLGRFVSNSQFEFLKPIARSLHLDDPEDPEFETARDDHPSLPEFCYELLIALLPNIETLRLHIEDEDNYEPTSYSFLQRRFRTTGSPGLPTLRHVEFETQSDWGFSFTNGAVGVVIEQAPNLEHLVFRRTRGYSIVQSQNREVPPEVSFAKLQKLRRLEFHNSAFEDGRSREILSLLVNNSTAGLEYFRFSSQWAYLGENVEMRWMRYYFWNLLLPQAKTLKVLDLDLTDHPGDADGSDSSAGDALKFFTQIQKLKIDESFVCRHSSNPHDKNWACITQALSRTVSNLVVRTFGISDIWYDLFELGAQAVQGKFPNLKAVSVRAYVRDEFSGDRSRNEFHKAVMEAEGNLRASFRDTGVVVSVIRDED